MKNKIMIQCATAVNRDAIRRESIDGVEHVIVSSMTLPDNIVMNEGLYPAEEINKSFHTLERTLAPVEHPQDENGNFMSASDPMAIHNYHAGAFNVNVEKVGDRIKIDKYINVQEALKTERGKRLLDRINEIETSDSPRPIHTSVGVFLDVELLGEAKTNAAGQKYTWIAHDMTFDHDAILLDSVGAAQPNQGVGIAVNNDVEYEVQTFALNTEDDSVVAKKTDLSVQRVMNAYADRVKANQDGMSLSELHESVMQALLNIGLDVLFIEELFEEDVVFQTSTELFTVPYRVGNDVVTIVGIPVPVERNVSFEPKANTEGEAMKEMILNALKEAGVEVEGLTDDQLFAKYNEHLQANQDSVDGNQATGDAEASADAVTNALKPIIEKLESIEGKLNAQDDAELTQLAEIVGNSGKYPGLDAESAKSLPLEKLKEMAANCGRAFGISPMVNNDSDDTFKVSEDMPE